MSSERKKKKKKGAKAYGILYTPSHKQFIEAIEKLGGAEKCGERMRLHFTSKTTHDGAKERINDLQMAQALQMQMGVQSKLHEQIEIQRHLQLQVESQGKYLRTILRRAEETISVYGSCSVEAEDARAKLAELVSMVDSTCPSLLNDEGDKGSLERSSLTSPSQEERQGFQVHGRCKNGERNFLSLSLMDMPPATKRIRSVHEGRHVEQSKRPPLMDTFDLNNEFESKLIDLNRKGDVRF